MTQGADSTSEIVAIEELRFLGDTLRRVDTAAAAAEWDDVSALKGVVAEAQAELTSMRGAAGYDISAAGASPAWLARADDFARAVSVTRGLTPPPAQAAADTVIAVGLARAAVAEAVLAVAKTYQLVLGDAERVPVRRMAVLRAAYPLPAVGRRIVDEVRHVAADKPRAILARLVITLAISLSLVTFNHVSGWSSYNDLGSFTLYLFSAVVGSIVCTNALCFEAERVRTALSSGERMWRSWWPRTWPWPS
jgi:hypothetical protein